jgi:hypothetical protein
VQCRSKVGEKVTSILGSGDPAFYHSDRDAAEAERELQIKYEDSIFNDGRRSCYDCENVHDGESMIDWEAEGYVWKLCPSCSWSRDREAMYSNYGMDPYREFGIAKGFENTYTPAKEQ